ncbi:RagB/SusD family nutrient uptake outer membrane protein [Flavobacteriaceae bacterium F89]|uniref:RagB/SusD family nutrient uptake outer membrane protein n=1 Tax=Cerina litoralis TaxID=2874477 RepID=A0AAE3JTM3_9FLAO|nr:RagB/SusD family nutrient uptake outer membrane protein [Cerina litoralis]MCG2461642.1 RagB/SusD family nutrient uptake outer membrane protein [Cerina litoralis]
MKRIKKIYFSQKILLWFLFAFLVSGCETLDEDPQSFISPDKYYTSVGQGETILASSLSFLWNLWTPGGYGENYYYFQLVSDQFYKQTLVIPEDNGDIMWVAHYKSITNLNNALKSIAEGSMQGAQEDIDRLVGQLKFVRAFNYFALVRLFGGVPLYTETSGEPLENPLPRATIAEVYDQIIADLIEAKKFLPVSWPDGQEARIKKVAAQALLTKVYLTRATAPLNQSEYFKMARDEAFAIMNGESAPTLIHDVHDVFKYENKYSSEFIFSFNSTSLDRAISARSFGPSTVLDGWGDFPASVKLDTEWPDQPRKDAYLRTEISDEDGTVFPYQTWGPPAPCLKKFSQPYVPKDEYENYNDTWNLPVLRYPDVLLMFAEAENLLNGGPTPAAVDAVNQVIDRANDWEINPNYPRLTLAMSMQEFDDAVIRERNFELCFEFDRMYDLYRKRILDRESPLHVQNFSENDYLWPIPQDDLRQNPLLTQNPGYSSPN